MTDSSHYKLPRKLWFLLIFSALISFAVFMSFPAKSHFVFDSQPGFYAFIGFMLPLLLVIVTRILGHMLKKREDYWLNPSLKRQRGEK